MMDKNKIISENERRHAARGSFRARVERARLDLHPRTLTDKWKERQLAKISTMAHAVTDRTAQTIRKNALLIGAVSAGALLFTARKPLFNMVRNFQKKPTPTPTEQDPQ